MRGPGQPRLDLHPLQQPAVAQPPQQVQRDVLDDQLAGHSRAPQSRKPLARRPTPTSPRRAPQRQLRPEARPSRARPAQHRRRLTHLHQRRSRTPRRERGDQPMSRSRPRCWPQRTATTAPRSAPHRTHRPCPVSATTAQIKPTKQHNGSIPAKKVQSVLQNVVAREPERAPQVRPPGRHRARRACDAVSRGGIRRSSRARDPTRRRRPPSAPGPAAALPASTRDR